MNTKKFTAKEIYFGVRSEFSASLSYEINWERDDCQGAPWEECDGHGPVSDWTTRDKRPGERVISSDRGKKRFYDYAEAIRLAKKDGWDAPPYKTGTKGEQAVRAVESDFTFLEAWCNDRWEYACFTVKLYDAEGEEVASDSLCGVETWKDYHREVAADLLNDLLSSHDAETQERAHWEARDTITA